MNNNHYKNNQINDIIPLKTKENVCFLWGNIMWKKVEYTPSQIKKAGKQLSKSSLNKNEELESLNIVNNWRASHAFPLHIITCHLKRITRSDTIVVQRLKRLDSIIGKLKRIKSMDLYKMQDLGGCRVIVNSIDEVYETVSKLKKSRMRHILKNENDYIGNPKPSGYRSYHMIYQYHSDRSETYNKNMLIEIQIRTHLQHVWATAIETMGIYTHSALKASNGNEDVLRFFALVSSLFAISEGLPVVPGTYDTVIEIKKELIEINEKQKILDTLKAIRVAIEHVKDIKNAGYYILKLNFSEGNLSIFSYRTSEIDIATNLYNGIEAENNPQIDVVLVAATSLSALRAAYPNYFTDIGEFITIVESYLVEVYSILPY